MKIDIYRESQIIIISLIGKLDINQVHNLEELFYRQVEVQPATIAIMMKECTYIDSAAIVSFVRFKNLARKNRIDLICYNLNDNIARIFNIAKMDKYLTIMSENEFLEKYVNR